MNESKISVRYAKALLSFGKEENILPRLREDIELLNKSITSITEFKEFLMNPVIKTSGKLKFIASNFKNNIHPATHSFLTLIIKNRREAFILSISRVFLDLFRKNSGIKSATLTTSRTIDDKLRNSIIKYITKKLDINIELDERINERLIGGFILRIEDQQIDASVLNRLNNIKKELLTA